MSEGVVAFGAYDSEVFWVVSSACVYWCDVVDLSAGCSVADCAGWLFSEDYCSVFSVFGVVVLFAHIASASQATCFRFVSGVVSCRAHLGCLCFVFNVSRLCD